MLFWLLTARGKIVVQQDCCLGYYNNNGNYMFNEIHINVSLEKDIFQKK